MAVYYNEWEPYPAQWLRNLIKAGHLPEGEVDERDIRTIQPEDLKGFTQCHFFAGIGGWPLALKLAGWGERPVWTGSCPCQGYSNAGAKRGRQDERHLWPSWFSLIKQCRPTTLFGEQVANAITYGWLDEAFYDLESEAYACASKVLRACSVNRPHERRRVFFVAQSAIGDDYRESFLLQGTHERKESERSQMGNAEFSHANVVGEDWPLFSDGLKRPPLPEYPFVADGLPEQLAIELAVGNAIVPQVAQAFIEAFMECRA